MTPPTAAASILVVDDDAYVCLSLQALLEEEGYRVRTAGSGIEGLRLLQEEPPDLVILDLLMPDMDGLEVCRRIREVSTVPVLMLTARMEEQEHLRTLVAGASGYLIKPVSQDKLRKAIRAALRRGDVP